MKYFLVLLMAAVAFTGMPDASSAWAAADDAVAAAPADPAVVERSRIGRKEKRELGILPVQVLKRAKELSKEGSLTKDMSAKEMAFILAADASDSAEYGSVWKEVRGGTYGADRDQIMDFLERLFELLMKFLPFFM